MRRPRGFPRLGAVIASGTVAPEVIDGWAEHLPDEYLQCRDYLHAWLPHLAGWVSSEGCWKRTVRCSRCGTLRTQKLSPRGAILSASYDYPEGYQAPRGTGLISGDGRAALRLTSLMRELKGDG